MAEENGKKPAVTPTYPTPIPTPFPSAAMGFSPQIVRDMRRRGQRYLFINVVLMFFISIVVFVVGTFFFVVPRIVATRWETLRIESKMAELKDEIASLQQALEEEIPAPAEQPQPATTEEGKAATPGAEKPAPAPAPTPPAPKK